MSDSTQVRPRSEFNNESGCTAAGGECVSVCVCVWGGG